MIWSGPELEVDLICSFLINTYVCVVCVYVCSYISLKPIVLQHLQENLKAYFGVRSFKHI